MINLGLCYFSRVDSVPFNWIIFLNCENYSKYNYGELNCISSWYNSLIFLILDKCTNTMYVILTRAYNYTPQILNFAIFGAIGAPL